MEGFEGIFERFHAGVDFAFDFREGCDFGFFVEGYGGAEGGWGGGAGEGGGTSGGYRTPGGNGVDGREVSRGGGGIVFGARTEETVESTGD